VIQATAQLRLDWLLASLGVERENTMAHQKAHDLLRKHNISVQEVKERKHSLHHLRNIVHSEQLPFDVFKALVDLRR